jgi:hypothetical protein
MVRMAVPLTEKFISAYVDRSLEIDCSKVTLREGKEHSPQIFEGPGLIAQDKAGAFQLRMFPRDVSQLIGFQMLFANQNVPPGVLLPPEAFYSLEATDWEGHTWTCPRVHPQMSSGRGGAVIRAEVDPLLSVRTASGASSHWLRLVYPETLKLAWNQSTHDTLMVGDRKLREKVERTRAEFAVGDLSFEIQRYDEVPVRTTVVVRSATPMPAGIEWRVREALRFIMFRGVSWGIAEAATGSHHRIQIVPPQTMRRTLLDPPLQVVDRHEDYWRLFGVYLKHVCKHADPSTFHPLSGQLNAILDAQSPHIEVLALLLSVTAEGILKHEFAQLAIPSKAFVAELDKAPALIQAMPCDERLKSRLCGVLDGMRTSSVKDKLNALKEQGLVSESSIRAWEKLRNKAAHATQLDPLEHQEHLNRCYHVYELLLRLIYIAVGYEGTYRRYSAEQWPLAQFPPNPSEAALGAGR